MELRMPKGVRSSPWRHSRNKWVSSYLLRIKTIYCGNINNSIIKACTSLLLLVLPVTIDSSGSSPQEVGAGHSDFVVITWVTVSIQSIHSRCHFCLAIALHPSSLTPQRPEIFWIIRISTPFTCGQTPSLMYRQPLSPILLESKLRSNDIG